MPSCVQNTQSSLVFIALAPPAVQFSAPSCRGVAAAVLGSSSSAADASEGTCTAAKSAQAKPVAVSDARQSTVFARASKDATIIVTPSVRVDADAPWGIKVLKNLLLRA